jgi:hypothetical protein
MNSFEMGFLKGALELEKTAAMPPAAKKAAEAARAAATKAAGGAAKAGAGAAKAAPEAVKKLIEMAKRHPFLAGGLGGYLLGKSSSNS